ncbi:MAG: diacylglycerol kinase family protein [Novosphingobium sp.]
MVVNGASGSHDEAVIAGIVQDLASAGAEPERVIDCQRDDLPDAPALDAHNVDLLVLHGGDGTLNAAISKVRGWGGAVLPLPGGTANLLCHILFDDLEARAIVAAMAADKLRLTKRNIIEVDGHIALAEVLAGPGAAWADVREDMRDGQVGDVVAGAIEAATLSTTGPMAAIAEPDMGDPEGYAGVLLTPQGKGLFVEGYAARDLGDLIKQGAALLGRNFRDGPHDDLGEHRHVICRSLADAPIPLMVDGERHDAGAEVKCSLAPLGLDLFCLIDD